MSFTVGGTSYGGSPAKGEASAAIAENRARQQGALALERAMRGLSGSQDNDANTAIAENRERQQSALARERAPRELQNYRERVSTARGWGLPGPVNLDDIGEVRAANARVHRGAGIIRDAVGGYDREISQNAYHEAAIMDQVDGLVEQLSAGNVHYEDEVLQDDNVGRLMDIAAVPASFMNPLSLAAGVLGGPKGLPKAGVGVMPGLGAIKSAAELVLNDQQRSALIAAGLLDEEEVERVKGVERPRNDGGDPQRRVQLASVSPRYIEEGSYAGGLGPVRRTALSARRFERR